MISLTLREKQLLKKIEDKNNYTSLFLSTYLNVSNRTIKSDIQRLNVILQDYGALIQATPGVGYSLIITNESKFSVIKDSIHNDFDSLIPTNKFERSIFIIRKLINLNRWITVEEIANRLFVSKQTVFNEMKDIKLILKDYGLELKSSVNGICIYGDELKKRKCYNDYYYQIFTNDKNSINTKLFANNTTNIKIKKIRAEIENILSKYTISMSDDSIKNLSTHIMIAIERQENNFSINSCNHCNYINDENILNASRELCYNLQKSLNVRINTHEMHYIQLHMYAKSIINYNHQVTKDIDILLKIIALRIYKRFKLNINNNEDLLKLLRLHIPTMVFRVKEKLFLRNSLSFRILRHYQYAVEICLEAVDEIEKWYGIELDENEFAYLVVYFNLAIISDENQQKKRLLILCSQGRPVEMLLLNELSEKYNMVVSEIKVINEAFINNHNYHENDILITTEDIHISLGIPFIQVTNKIENYYSKIYDLVNSKTFTNPNFKDFFTEKDLIKDATCQTKNTVINLLYRELCKDIESHEARNLIMGIFPSFSELGKHVVVLHSLYDTYKPILKIITLKSEIIWNKSFTKVIIFCNINQLPKSKLISAFHCLSEWCDEETKKIINIDSLIDTFNYYIFH